jgi:nuclear pore complex protein Nup62
VCVCAGMFTYYVFTYYVPAYVCIYVCVCMYVCTYVRMHICACMYVFVRMYVCVCIYVCVCVYVCTYVCKIYESILHVKVQISQNWLHLRVTCLDCIRGSVKCSTHVT